LPHGDVVGSLLRPPKLLHARDALASGAMSPSDFQRIEDKAVDDAVALQQDAGLHIVTDGEMRRLSFQSALPEAVEGFGEFDINAFLWGDWYGDDHVGNLSQPRPSTLGVTGKLKRTKPFAAHEFAYLANAVRNRTGEPAAEQQTIPKVTLPSPSLFANFWSPQHSISAYPTIDAFLADVANVLREEIVDLVALGATYIQLDAPHYPLVLDPAWADFYTAQGRSVNDWMAQSVALDNAVMAGWPGVTFALHLCKGNQGSRWLTSGGYEGLVAPVLAATSAQRLMLEYDDARSGSFEPLRGVPDDKLVVLGLATTKRPDRESVIDVLKRFSDAADHFPIDQLGVSPQCGFATSIIGNAITPDDQRRKLKVVADVEDILWPHQG
jgi:5-methyltetrahydropteroyltriglutamate--homocysteine methyltransferase